MNDLRGSVLFVPVSGPRGMGEYARALAIANAAAARWPGLDIHFVLSSAAPYANSAPFPTTLLPSSPTFHSNEVVELIGNLRPALIVFDNAGRSAQLRAAARSGARVVFVSSRPRQRRRAFRLRWMRWLDEHWIAWPRVMAGEMGPLERLKLALLGRPVVRFLDAILPPEDPALAAQLMAEYSLDHEDYVLVVPGGGTGHPGAEDAPAVIAEAARRIAAHGTRTVLVGISAPEQIATLQELPRMPMPKLIELMRHAKLVVSNGGDTLLQAIACARPCVAAPIAGDQRRRIEACERKGLAVGARLDAADLERAIIPLLDSAERRLALTRRAKGGDVRNGMDTALEAIENLLRAGRRAG